MAQQPIHPFADLENEETGQFLGFSIESIEGDEDHMKMTLTFSRAVYTHNVSRESLQPLFQLLFNEMSEPVVAG